MSTLIVAFPKIEEARAVRSLLVLRDMMWQFLVQWGTGYQSGRCIV